jgi:hypothetical protein
VPPPAARDRTQIPTDPAQTKVPTALVTAPTRLALAKYDLRPATFQPWKDYLAGDPKGRAWERVPWHTTLWDAVADAQAQDRPILLEIHGGNALGRC